MLRPPLAVFCFSVLVLSFSFTTTPAQETTGSIEGRLVDDAGKPVAFANINVTSPSLQGGRGVMSTSDGYFGVFTLPVGIYKVTISHVSFQEVIYEVVDVRLGRTTSLGKVTLASRTYEAPAVIVSETKPLIDPTTTTVGANLASGEFRDLPLERDYQKMPALLPNVNESYFGDAVNFAGATGQGNKYFVDGVETTDPFMGRTATSLPYNFVRDLQVRTGGYQAEYRSSLGGIMNVVSHSGSNEFHGQLFGFFVNNQFAGDSRLGVGEPTTGDFAQYDAGLSVGGPIKKDRLWFFAAYDPTFRTEDVEIPGIGFYQDKAVTHVFAGKLDWRIASRTNAMLTVLGDPGTRDGVGAFMSSAPSTPVSFENPDPFLMDVTTGSTNVLLTGTHMFNDEFILEGSVSRNARREKHDGLTERGRNEFTFIDTETGTYSGGMGEVFDAQSVQYTSGIKATLIRGRHTLKTGAEYRDNKLDYRENYHYLYRYSDSSYTDIHFMTPDGTVRNRIPSVFVQDSWRVTDRIRLNAGLRWDGQFLVGSDGKVHQKITDQYQPRIGIIYHPSALMSQKIFASYGRFYQELGMVLSNFHHNAFQTYAFTDYDHDPRIDPSGGDEHSGGGEISPEVKGLKGQYFDEFTLGYEEQVSAGFAVGLRGIYRTLGQCIEDALVEKTGEFNYGNPGRGDLSDYPKAKRDYIALELTTHLVGGDRYSARASYVLSRNEGNYTGIYETEYFNNPLGNFTAAFDLPEMSVNGIGLLPNDRTHVVKLSGTYRMAHGLSTGAAFSWQSGTPLSALEASSWGFPYLVFARERGSAGRTPSIWDLNLRFVYDVSYALKTTMHPRLILDLFHVASQRKPVDFDEVRNFDRDDAGNQINPNPTYGLATRFQPPMSVRLGLEVNF